MTLVCNAVLAPLVLKEEFNRFQVAGTLLIIAGIAGLTLSAPESPAEFDARDSFGMYVRERSEWKHSEPRAAHSLARRCFLARCSFALPAVQNALRAGAFWCDSFTNRAFWQTSLATACSGAPRPQIPFSGATRPHTSLVPLQPALAHARLVPLPSSLANACFARRYGQKSCVAFSASWFLVVALLYGVERTTNFARGRYGSFGHSVFHHLHFRGHLLARSQEPVGICQKHSGDIRFGPYSPCFFAPISSWRCGGSGR